MRAILTLGSGKRRRRAPILASGVSLLALATACSGSVSGGSDDGPLQVVASFYPLAEAARRVGGDCVTVTDLTPPGVEPHDLELTPDALEAIVTADLVVYLGAGFQPAIEEGLPEAKGVTVDAMEGQGVSAEGSVDPHVWLDPSRYSLIVQAIAAGLREAGAPEDCPIEARTSAFRDELALIDAEIATGLADCEDDVIVTNHEAFGYLAEAYGLRQEAIAGLELEAADARRLAELRDLVTREGVTTIFTEELVPPDVAETLASEVGAATEVLSTIESEPEAGDYLAAMRENLRKLRDALGCA
jgi:zinc transport system substrate-binding protein